MNAETTFAAPWGMRSVPASMGPRSHERGNIFFQRQVQREGSASMGPRSHERGNVIRLPLLRSHACRSFNGAAFS